MTIRSPPTHHKANALQRAAAIFGCCAKAVRQSPSWSPENQIQSAWSKGRPFGATSLRKRCPKDCCAAIFRQSMLLNCWTAPVSHRPLGKDTSSLMGLWAAWPLKGLLSIAMQPYWPFFSFAMIFIRHDYNRYCCLHALILIKCYNHCKCWSWNLTAYLVATSDDCNLKTWARRWEEASCFLHIKNTSYVPGYGQLWHIYDSTTIALNGATSPWREHRKQATSQQQTFIQG